MSNQNIPEASDLDSITPISKQEIEDRENLRNSYIKTCRDFVFLFIKKNAPEKIKYTASKKEKNNCFIFRFSSPKSRGEKTRYFSQVALDLSKNECYLDYERPTNHSADIWYFPIYYMINGFTKNKYRTFQAIGLKTVYNLLTDLFTKKGYKIKFNRSRRINDPKLKTNVESGNLIIVEWKK